MIGPVKMYKYLSYLTKVDTFIENLKEMGMSNALKNWKTTVPALISLAMLGLGQFGIVSHDQANLVMGLMVSFGLVKAKDADVTGGSR